MIVSVTEPAAPRRRAASLNSLLYSSIFLVTQVTGLLLSLAICYILQDFIWGFVRMALVNSFILGLTLVGACYFTQRSMFKLRTLYMVAISSSAILGAAIISLPIVLSTEPVLFLYYGRGAISFLLVNFLFIAALHAISSGLIIYREIMADKERTIGNERNLRNRMEMQLLSSRVNPHFLFNTLNMILTLLKQPAKAEQAILNLSDLLRENLEQSAKDRIPVAQEMENVRKYLEIQTLRFGERLHYDITGEADFSIPPLIVQPLVENSIKHNIDNTSRLSLEIALSHDARRNSIVVVDSQKALDGSMLDRGQGLTITKQRVENANGTFVIREGGVEMSFPR